MYDLDKFATVARMTYDRRMNHWRLLHDILETFARCWPDEVANIYDHRLLHDVITNVVRQSRDGFARNT